MKHVADRRSFLKTTGAAGIGLSSLGGRRLSADALTEGAPTAERLGWRLGCQTWCFYRFTTFEAIEKTASLGLKYFETGPEQRLSEEHPDVMFTEAAPAKVRKAVKKKLADSGVKLEGWGVCPLHRDIGESRKTFEFAKDIGARTIVAEPDEDAMDTVEMLCEEYEIDVAVHNHARPSHYWHPDAVLKACRGRSDRIGACADIGHWMRSGLNPLESLKRLEGRLLCFHFKDLDQLGPNAVEVPLGTGAADVRAILAEIHRQRIRAFFAIEYGYLGAYPEKFFDRLEASQEVWAPYYTLHKILAGLLDAYIYCDNRQALETCKKAVDWVIVRNGKLTDEQMQKMLDVEYGGMNEALANLYALTGEEKYLKIAQRFNHLAVLDPASRREDRLTGLHANTQIPKFVGAARQYELTGEDRLKTTALFFWDTVAEERSYAIGGNSDGEVFSPKEKLSEALSCNTAETCNTYNMLKLTRHLFCWDPQVKYTDYCERALYNHIVASQHPETGALCYYMPLCSGMTRGGTRGYSTPTETFFCCTGTGVENHAKYGESIYFHGNDGEALYVNLFVASELNWKAKGLKLRQETQYPDQPGTRLLFTCKRPVELSLRIRRPWWATAGFEVRLNGRPQAVDSRPASYAQISRVWSNGDTVEVSVPFSLHIEGFADNPRRFAFMYGPLVLCAEVPPEKPFPAVVAMEDGLLAGLTPIPGRPSTFAGSPDVFRVLGEEDGREVVLEPFHKMHGDRPYMVYFDAYSPAEWQTKEAVHQAELARRKKRDAQTVDVVKPGDEENERDHKLQGERTAAGDFRGHGWRHATGGGWFSWEMKVLPDKAQELHVTYWGSDVGRIFDILVGGVTIAAERMAAERPNQFYDRVYAIPPDLVKGKDKITVRFQAHPRETAGGVFGCRVVPSE